jgi:hypothetical protein
MLPAVLKSAVQSANTAIFISSSFDFIRVHNYFRKNSGVSFAVLSEYVVFLPLFVLMTCANTGHSQILLKSRYLSSATGLLPREKIIPAYQ